VLRLFGFSHGQSIHHGISGNLLDPDCFQHVLVTQTVAAVALARLRAPLGSLAADREQIVPCDGARPVGEGSADVAPRCGFSVAHVSIDGIFLAMILSEAFFHAPGTPEALPDLCRRFHVRRLDLFGSAATGRGFDSARSDLDLLVDFEPLAPIDYAEAYFGLREGLEALSGRPVDLVTEAALENPHLRRRLETERRALYRAL